MNSREYKTKKEVKSLKDEKRDKSKKEVTDSNIDGEIMSVAQIIEMFTDPNTGAVNAKSVFFSDENFTICFHLVANKIKHDIDAISDDKDDDSVGVNDRDTNTNTKGKSGYTNANIKKTLKEHMITTYDDKAPVLARIILQKGLQNINFEKFINKTNNQCVRATVTELTNSKKQDDKQRIDANRILKYEQ